MRVKRDSKGAYAEIAARAEKAVQSVEDQDLRRIAFDRILQQMLEGLGADAPPLSHPERKVSTAKRFSTQRSSKEGPTGWLEGLIKDGFFDEEQGQREILEKLGERGRELQDSQITQQLLSLVRRGLLKRRKVQTPSAQGMRKVWKYRRV